MATAPTGWPLLATGSNDTNGSCPCPSGPGGSSLHWLPVHECLAISVGSLNPALSKSSTLLSALLFPARTVTNPARGFKKGRQSLQHHVRLNVYPRPSDVCRHYGQDGAHHGARNLLNGMNAEILVASLPCFRRGSIQVYF